MAGLLSGVLPAVYSAGDKAKRLAKQLLSDPMGYAAQTAGAIQDEARQQEQLMGQAFTNPQRPLQVTNPQALSQASNRMMTGLMGFAPAGITVWHGSPHTFSKFDASKIGTGEGAQAYGHGLYFAESPAVAKQYQEGLSDMDLFVQGRPFDTSNPLHRAAAAVDEAARNGRPIEETIQRLQRSIADLRGRGKDWATELANEQEGTLKSIISGGVPKLETATKGHLYKVDLPDEAVAKMLDWDKPLSQQSKEVQGAIKKSQFFKDAMTRFKETKQWYDDPRQKTGESLLKYIRSGTGDVAGGSSQYGMAEDYLKAQGISGIRYLDQGSRGTGQGTSNFVVFPGNEGLLSILERNGKPIK